MVARLKDRVAEAEGAALADRVDAREPLILVDDVECGGLPGFSEIRLQSRLRIEVVLNGLLIGARHEEQQ